MYSFRRTWAVEKLKIIPQLGGACQSFAHELCAFKECTCECHNKKEEKPLHGHALGVSCTPDCFNRETPKVPEKLIRGWQTEEEIVISNKLNQLIDYLKAKE